MAKAKKSAKRATKTTTTKKSTQSRTNKARAQRAADAQTAELNTTALSAEAKLDDRNLPHAEPGTGQSLADHTMPVHLAAAQVAAADPQVIEQQTDDFSAAVSERRNATQKAVAEREAEIRRRNDEQQRQRDEAQRNRMRSAGVGLTARDMPQTLRAPVDPDRPAGIHPDVTSPTDPLHLERVPGTGVAPIEDLAPGQDMSPSPPISSSNIVPQPEKVPR